MGIFRKWACNEIAVKSGISFSADAFIPSDKLGTSRYQKGSAESIAGILAAAVAVKDRSFKPSVLLSKLSDGIYAEFFLHIITHFKGNDLAVIAVKNRRDIEFSVCALDFGDVR